VRFEGSKFKPVCYLYGLGIKDPTHFTYWVGIGLLTYISWYDMNLV
jgi:hypothetical protein